MKLYTPTRNLVTTIPMVIVINYIKMTLCIQAFYTRWLTDQRVIFENRAARVYSFWRWSRLGSPLHIATRDCEKRKTKRKNCARSRIGWRSPWKRPRRLKDWRKILRLPAHREYLYRGKRYGRLSPRQWCSYSSRNTQV